MTALLDLVGDVRICRRRLPRGDFIMIVSDAGAVTYDAGEARAAAKAIRAQVARCMDAEIVDKAHAVAACLEREALLLDTPAGARVPHLADLDGELFAATQAITVNHRRKLEEMHGIDALAFRRIGGLGIARIDRCTDGSYQPTGSGVVGEVSLIWPVWYGAVSDRGLVEGELIDLLAWSPEHPARFSRRTGEGFALGMAAIERAWSGGIGGLPLRLYRSPLAWARAGAYAAWTAEIPPAAMILEWGIDNGLFQVGTIVCEDEAQGEDVEHLLKLLRVKLTPRLPAIKVPRIAEKIAQAG